MLLFKSLTGNISRNRLHSVWEDPSNPSADGQAYQWRSTIAINPRTHSDSTTLTPFELNGLDIKVGSWVGDFLGQVYKVIELNTISAYSVVLVLEDIGLVNSLNDLSTAFNGAPFVGSCVIFDLSSNGVPILDGLSENDYQSVSISNVNARFAQSNPLTTNVSVFQTNNGFVTGDFIKVDEDNDGRYELCAADEINLAVGIVNTINNPKPDYFTFKPLVEIENNVQPPLEGDYGDIFYMDPANPGKVTGIKPATKAKPVYIRLETANRAVRLNAITDDGGSESKSITVIPTVGQTEFTLPIDAVVVLVMSINGIENKNFTFDTTTKVLVFDPNATGYGLDDQDEVIFVYTT